MLDEYISKIKLESILNSFTDTNDRKYMREALNILREADKNGIILRLIGSLAIRLKCPKYSGYLNKLDRRITDIDLASETEYREKIIQFFENRNYLVDQDMLYGGGGFRYIFDNSEKGIHIDIFFDSLPFCHTVVLKNRLNIDKMTISSTDLLLEKMQIVKIDIKDLKDTSILLLENDLGKDDSTINLNFISKIMSNDWGFYYTFTNNLNRLINILDKFEVLNHNEKQQITEKANKVLNIIENSEKSLKWKIRSKLGTKMKWYTEVD